MTQLSYVETGNFPCLTKNDNKMIGYSPINTLTNAGYIASKKISKTLQGSIYQGYMMNKYYKENIVIKRCNKKLSKYKVTIKNNIIYKVNENILKEMNILKYITNYGKNIKGFTKYIDFIEDNKNYFLIQNYGGINLFDYVSNEHNLIKNNNISIKKWKINCIQYYIQIINVVNWLNNRMNIIHFDISLENMLYDPINNQINLCDFGLSELFLNNNNNNCESIKCVKFVGKSNYKSPEIQSQIPFNPFKSEIFSMGVCLFIIYFGLPPFNKATLHDMCYTNILNGHLNTMLTDWDMQRYIDNDMTDLFSKIFVPENKRINMNDIMKHTLFNGYSFNNF